LAADLHNNIAVAPATTLLDLAIQTKECMCTSTTKSTTQLDSDYKHKDDAFDKHCELTYQPNPFDLMIELQQQESKEDAA
jgi:hypothetical protein